MSTAHDIMGAARNADDAIHRAAAEPAAALFTFADGSLLRVDGPNVNAYRDADELRAAEQPHYALIDNASGYVWWDGTATTPEEACIKATLELQGVEAVYVAASELASNEHGYHVYAAPDGFMVIDGQDQDNIDEVQAMPLVGKYRLA